MVRLCPFYPATEKCAHSKKQQGWAYKPAFRQEWELKSLSEKGTLADIRFHNNFGLFACNEKNALLPFQKVRASSVSRVAAIFLST